VIRDRPNATQDPATGTPQGVVLPFPNRMDNREPYVEGS
jgi:hypothetical protein